MALEDESDGGSPLEIVSASESGDEEANSEEERENQRAELHDKYLKTLKKIRKSGKPYSPVGSFVVVCKDLEEGWSENTEDLRMHIYSTEQEGIFKADVDFGVLEGVMIIGPDSKAVEEYCAALDREDESDDDESEEEDGNESASDTEDSEDGAKVQTGQKRKSKASSSTQQPTKKSKSSSSEKPGLKYVLRLKYSETGEGEIQYEAERGRIRFTDRKMASFSGNTSIDFVGQSVPFSGRKISDQPPRSRRSWTDYSESRHEEERVSRWH